MRAIFSTFVAITSLVLLSTVASAQGIGGAERGGAERGAGPTGGMERGAPGAGAERGGNMGAANMPKEGAGPEGVPPVTPKKGAESNAPKQGAESPVPKEGAAGTAPKPSAAGTTPKEGTEGGAQKQQSLEKGRENEKSGAPANAADKGNQPGAKRAANISPAQQTKVQTTIRSSIRSKHVENVRNVNFAVRVGTLVPTRYHYYPLPPEVIEIVPEYRGYDFIYVNNLILILDPVTHEIVYIL